MAAEVFCGHAGIATALQQQGFEVKAIDWQGNKHKPRIPILRHDLTLPEEQQRVRKDLKSALIKWLAPPCGTMTRAREIPVPQWLIDQGAPTSMP